MEAKLSTLFLGQELYGTKLHVQHFNQVHFNPSHSRRFFRPSCKIRPRSFSSQGKRQQGKKFNPGNQTTSNSKPNGDEEFDQETASKKNEESDNNVVNEVETLVKAESEDGKNEESDKNVVNEVETLVKTESEDNNNEESDKNVVNEAETLVKTELEDGNNEESDKNVVNEVETLAKSELEDDNNEENITESSSKDNNGILHQDIVNDALTIEEAENADLNSLLDIITPPLEAHEEGGVLDLIDMIKNAEKNIHLLNEARINVVQDFARVVGEKESLQREINVLETKLAETDARIIVAAQDKIRVKLLEDQLEKLKEELSSRRNSDEANSVPLINNLDLLSLENTSLKNDLEVVKAELSNMKGTDERVKTLEKERLVLAATLNELELKLKESVEEASVYKRSSEKLQKYNELMQEKIEELDKRLQKSDEEINSYIQLYKGSMDEFQDTLSNLKEESIMKKTNQTVDDMPWEFWSSLLLTFDGWFLEKKITADDSRLLREMAWGRDSKIYDTYMLCKDKEESEIISSFLKLIVSPTRSGLHVIHIAAEMAPVAKVGGLGDVVTGLGKALQKKGHLVEILIPKYDCMKEDCVKDLKVLDVAVESYFDGQLFKNKIWTGTVEGLPVYFIEPHHPGGFFWRGQYYGEHDDFKRFSFFSRVALELIYQSGKKPDIIHCHDWQTAFVAPLYWDIYAMKGFNSARICFTCHNFEYQGAASAHELASCGLDVNHLNRPDRMQDNSSHHMVNPLKGAIVFSNIVTTVSPTYAQEVRSSEGGKGLHGTLNTHSKKFVGILNGIDTDSWNPATDSLLEVQFNASDLEGKADNKEALRRQLGLSSGGVRDRPLVACITRLVPQKGVHLIRHAIFRTLELGGQFVLLGSSPVPEIQREFEDIAKQFADHKHIRLLLKYDEALAHLIYAASDMFIIPSIFEPCGLTQMIAMRYGSIPITRKTGGLNDSVFDVDDDNIPVQFRNGYTFVTADEKAFDGAIERAFDHYNNYKENWKELVQKVMKIDFSWDASALLYEELYSKAVARARAVNRS